MAHHDTHCEDALNLDFCAIDLKDLLNTKRTALHFVEQKRTSEFRYNGARKSPKSPVDFLLIIQQLGPDLKSHLHAKDKSKLLIIEMFSFPILLP